MNRILSLILISVYLLNSFAGAQGPVMCFGQNGHVEVEYSHIDHCENQALVNCGQAPKSLKNTITATHDHNHHSPCVDIPFSNSTLHSAREKFQPKPLLFEYNAYQLTIVQFQHVALPAHWQIHTLRKSLPLSNQTLTALSTVILLT